MFQFKKIIFFSLTLFLCLQTMNSLSQTIHISQKIAFGNYLISSRQFDDALYFMEKIEIDTFTDVSVRDTLLYLKGLTRYNKKMLKASAFDLLKVSENSDYYLKSRFFASYNLAFEGNIDTAKSILSDLKLNENGLEELKNFELSGMALLQNDTVSFRKYAEKYTYNDNRMVNEEQNLMKYYKSTLDFKPKSKFVAGIMSAIIPGSGKFYAGYKGQGVAAFTTVAALGAITAENYIKNGGQDFKTILFGALFCIFYSGNIYGSIASVQHREKQFYEIRNYQVLFDMHIPLRTVFY